VFVDQSPIGKTTRSNPASYVGAFDAIREALRRRAAGEGSAATRRHVQLQLRQRPLPDLRRLGFEHVEMQFLSDVYLRCPDCDGKRYRAEILEVKIERRDRPGKSIADVLELTVPRRCVVRATTAR
jgi:excinuclease ABC subunit A